MKPSSGQSNQIADDIRTGSFSPVYYVHGEEEFLISETVSQLVDAAVKGADRGFNVDVVDGAEVDVRALVSLASTFPMMADRRVVVVSNADKIGDPDPLKAYVRNPSATTVLILTAIKPDKRRSVHKVLEDEARTVEYQKLYQNQVSAWIEKRAKKWGLSIDPAGSALLAEFIGTELREIESELEKLSVFAHGRKNLTAEDVQAVSGMTREISLYELQRAIGTRDAKQTMTILERLVDGGQAGIRIAVSLGYFFITARKLSDTRKRGGAESELRLRPSQLKDAQVAISRYNEVEIENALVSISIADEQLKSTSISDKQVLQFMAASILSGSGNSLTA